MRLDGKGAGGLVRSGVCWWMTMHPGGLLIINSGISRIFKFQQKVQCNLTIYRDASAIRPLTGRVGMARGLLADFPAIVQFTDFATIQVLT
jgi:hypothetical protein